MDGIFNIYKEQNYTSHDVVAVVRKIIGQKKAGHTGTLDPMAEGVLPVCLGKATKLSDYIMSDKKTYRAGVKLGITTDTQDIWGEILSKKTPVSILKDTVLKALSAFEGPQLQTPPMYSALKIQGKKLYELARQGKEVDRPARQITIYAIRLLDFSTPDSFIMEVECSKGTYIRTLCADIGEKLGTGAVMSSLTRIATGGFEISNSVTLEKLKEYADAGRAQEFLMPLEKALLAYPRVYVTSSMDKLLYNGGKIYASCFLKYDKHPQQGDIVQGLSSDGQLVGLFQCQEIEGQRFIRPLTMLI